MINGSKLRKKLIPSAGGKIKLFCCEQRAMSREQLTLFLLKCSWLKVHNSLFNKSLNYISFFCIYLDEINSIFQFRQINGQ